MWIAMCKRFIVLCILYVFSSVKVIKSNSCGDNFEVGEPLILTPLLEENKVAEAKELSRVKPDIGNVTSYSGYLTVNKECESNLFFWFFPAQSNWLQAPLVLFVQGGPGASSLYCLFEEVGPLTYNTEEGIGTRKYAWNVENNLLFIDQPVGSGFSFTRKGCFAENKTVVGNELYAAIVQFYQLFPEMLKNRFFIAGFSYGGHYIPALGHTIHVNNPSAKVRINLSGMVIGNGWLDVLYQNNLGSYLYQLGLVDDYVRDIYHEKHKELSECVKKEEWEKAMEIFTKEIGELYIKSVGRVSLYNYLEDYFNGSSPYMNKSYEYFVQTPKIRRAIHVGSTNFSFLNTHVAKSLGVDPLLSVKPLVEELLEHYFIVFYNGQLDVICNYPTLVNLLRSLQWSGGTDYRNATRRKWCVGTHQAGYYKGTHRLYDVLVRDAGHSVPYDQPHWAYVLVNSITSGPTDNPLHALNTC